jgi:hypothetical protein
VKWKRVDINDWLTAIQAECDVTKHKSDGLWVENS